MTTIGVQSRLTSRITLGWALVSASVLIALYGLRASATGSAATLAMLVVAQLMTYRLFASWSQRELFGTSTLDALLNSSPPPAKATPSPVFFLTYARADAALDDGAAIEKFFHDLERKVQEIQRAQQRAEISQVGTWDRRFRDGFLWHVALLQALNTVNVLILLGSNAAYRSKYCLSEVDFVVERARRTAAGYSGIIKVCWVPGGTEPALLLGIQDSRKGKYAQYDLFGLRQLVNPDKREAQVEYHRVVEEIADAIASAPILNSLASDEIPWILGPLGLKAKLSALVGSPSTDKQRARSLARTPNWQIAAILFVVIMLSLRTAMIYVGENMMSAALDVQSHARFERYSDQARACQWIDWMFIAARAPTEDIGTLEEVRAELERH